MGIFYLVRHGQANSTGLHYDKSSSGKSSSMEDSYDKLTDKGHAQAELTGEALRRRIGSVAPRIVAGPLNRQQDTARGIAAAWGAASDILTEPGLVEFNSDAVVAPYFASHPEVLQRIRDVHAQVQAGTARNKDHRIVLGEAVSAAIQEWDGTEDFHEFQNGVFETMDTIVREASSANGPVVVVTSGGVISVLVARALGGDWKKFIGRAFTASITVFSTGENSDGPLELVSYNEHAHVDEPNEDGERPFRRYR